MALGQKINDIKEPSRTRDATTEFKTIKKTWPSGRTTAKRQWSDPLLSWRVEWDALTLTEYQAILTHFKEHSGGYATFLFDDPHTATTHTVRYEDDDLDRRMQRRNTRGLYKLTVNLQEDKA